MFLMMRYKLLYSIFESVCSCSTVVKSAPSSLCSLNDQLSNMTEIRAKTSDEPDMTQNRERWFRIGKSDP